MPIVPSPPGWRLAMVDRSSSDFPEAVPIVAWHHAGDHPDIGPARDLTPFYLAPPSQGQFVRLLDYEDDTAVFLGYLPPGAELEPYWTDVARDQLAAVDLAEELAERASRSAAGTPAAPAAPPFTKQDAKAASLLLHELYSDAPDAVKAARSLEVDRALRLLAAVEQAAPDGLADDADELGPPPYTDDPSYLS